MAPEADLYRLVYCSRNRIDGSPEDIAGQVEAILATSRRLNAGVGITGALVFNAGMFAQVLEGARQDVEATMEHILRDERHGNIQVLGFERAEARGFPSWSMGYLGRSREGQSLFAHIGEATGFEAARLDGEHIFNVMRAIAVEEEAAATGRLRPETA
ncbi:MAG: BLUF domain-containing protein [Methylacidiphilales bacterium]|nr:BLUF domain-containing protein [Candidatus Methylacidiphilales bacterium]